MCHRHANTQDVGPNIETATENKAPSCSSATIPGSTTKEANEAQPKTNKSAPGFLTALTTTTMVAMDMRSVVMMPTPDPDGPDLICPDALWFRSEYLHVWVDRLKKKRRYSSTDKHTRYNNSWVCGQGKESSKHRCSPRLNTPLRESGDDGRNFILCAKRTRFCLEK